VVEKGLRPDIVVTDQDMPRMTEIEFVAWMKNNPELRHIPIILQSIHDIAADKHQADVFITKGDPDGFETALRNLNII
jgi:CheY-like chemotaxis protein